MITEKKSLQLLLKIIILGIIILGQSCNQNPEKKVDAQGKDASIQKSVEASPVKIGKDNLITVYYFHTTYRCYSCKTIEQYTRDAINYYFSNEIKNNKIIFQQVNIEQPGNEHFVKDFQLYTKSVVLVDLQKGKQVRWKLLDKTWNYIRDKERFLDYINSEVKQFMEASNG